MHIESNLPIVFMEKWFPFLPIEIQHKIINEKYKIPPPMFKKDQAVRLSRKNVLINICRHLDKNRGFSQVLKPHKLGKNIILEKPIWCWKKYCWLYPFDEDVYYDLTLFGIFSPLKENLIEQKIESKIISV